jgi:hypothetical protein
MHQRHRLADASDELCFSSMKPYLSERVRDRSMAVIAWAGVTGAALLFSDQGDAFSAGDRARDLDAVDLARRATLTAHGMTTWSFPYDGACAHATTVAEGWTLCVVSTVGATPAAVIERLERAAHVLALALRASGMPREGGTPPAGAPAHATVSARYKFNRG